MEALKFDLDETKITAIVGGVECELSPPSFVIFGKIQKMASEDRYDPDLVETYFKEVGLPEEVLKKLSVHDAGALMGLIEKAFLDKKKLSSSK